MALTKAQLLKELQRIRMKPHGKDCAVFDADGNPVATFSGLTRDPAEFIDFLKKEQ